MAEVTLESLAARVAELERRIAAPTPGAEVQDGGEPAWLRAVRENPGDPVFLREWAEECRRLREEDRRLTKPS